MKKIKAVQEKKIHSASESASIEFITKNKSRLINYAMVLVLGIASIYAVVVWKANQTTGALILFQQAKALYGKGNFEAARATYQQFVKKYAKHALAPAALLGEAYCYEELADMTQAKLVLFQLQREYPRSPWADEAAQGIERLTARK